MNYPTFARFPSEHLSKHNGLFQSGFCLHGREYDVEYESHGISLRVHIQSNTTVNRGFKKQTINFWLAGFEHISCIRDALRLVFISPNIRHAFSFYLIEYYFVSVIFDFLTTLKANSSHRFFFALT